MDAINFTQVLSSTITPVTLLTGVAFMTSIMAPRFGRCIDRIRVLLEKIEHQKASENKISHLQRQIEILYYRIKLLRNSMVAAGLCILFIVLTVGFNFYNLLMKSSDSIFSIIFFMMALVCLIFLVIGFTFDFFISLKAVRIEIDS